jgi:nicotinate phosphoribosyltransferase
LEEVAIIASGGLDEHEIARIIESGGKIDIFAVGTKMGVSADSPYTDMAYKLVSYRGRPVLKLSRAKQTLVSDKQVFRARNGGRLTGDMIGLRDERLDGEPLLLPIMKNGKRLAKNIPLDHIRNVFQNEFAMLDDQYKNLKKPVSFPVRLSDKLSDLQKRTESKVKARERVWH